MKRFAFLLTAFLGPMFVSHAQHQNKYCESIVKGNILKAKTYSEGVYLQSSLHEGNISMKLLNNTADTIFLFKSYFETDISTSKYIYRFDKKNNCLNISFLPLLPYLHTKYSDLIVNADKIIKDHQVVYSFYSIPPAREYSFTVKAANFHNFDNFVVDFDVQKLNKFQKINKFKYINTPAKISDIFVSIAYYRRINKVCDRDAYYIDELAFNAAASDFYIVKSSLDKDKIK